jgi:DNA-binding MarR family transcriptional regulator
MDATQILIKIRKIIRSINLESKQIQKQHGISIPQLLCLQFLYESDNYQATHKAIAGYLELNSSTVTGIINRLQKNGMVARLPKRDDKRNTYITLTSEGAIIFKSAPKMLHTRLSDKLETVSAETITTINDSLDTIIKLLGIENMDASPIIVADDFKANTDKK